MSLRIPKKYEDDLKVVKQAYEEVEKTHKGLGKLVLMEMLCDASQRTLLVIGSSGTGKSAVLKWMRENIQRDKYWLDACTISGLKALAKKLSDKTMTILIDDLSKGGTPYSQIMTVMAFGELVYTGFVKKYTAQLTLEIENFKGSVIMNAQPLILKRILKADEFETDIRDKVIRYYHLKRPEKVNLEPINVKVQYDYTCYDVSIPDYVYKHPLMSKGHAIFRNEFSKARAEEHFNIMIRASAKINMRKYVSPADLWLIGELGKNFIIETELFTKYDLEGPREMDVNIIPLLSIISTYGKYPLEDLMTEFQVKRSRLYEILEANKNWVAIVKNHGEKVIIPTRACQELLKKMGEW